MCLYDLRSFLGWGGLLNDHELIKKYGIRARWREFSVIEILEKELERSYLHSAAVKLKKKIIHFIYLFRFISLFGYEGHLLSEAN